MLSEIIRCVMETGQQNILMLGNVTIDSFSVQDLIWLRALDISNISYGLSVLMVCSIWLHITTVNCRRLFRSLLLFERTLIFSSARRTTCLLNTSVRNITIMWLQVKINYLFIYCSNSGVRSHGVSIITKDIIEYPNKWTDTYFSKTFTRSRLFSLVG